MTEIVEEEHRQFALPGETGKEELPVMIAAGKSRPGKSFLVDVFALRVKVPCGACDACRSSEGN